MQNIQVKRYRPELKEWQGTISPEDGSWIVFVDGDGEPYFYRRVERYEEGEKTDEVYVDVEIPCGLPVPEGAGPTLPQALESLESRPIDYTVEPDEEGFTARLNVRNVACHGKTEHEAVRELLNYVAQLCTAGSLDHTGVPSHGNKRRYEYVYGKGSATSQDSQGQ